MIIIIRALSQVRNEKRKAIKKRRPKKGRKAIKKEKTQKMREKERRDNVTILLPHLCFKVAPRSSQQRVSHVITFIYQWEFFIIELGLYIPMTGFLKMPQVFVSKQVGCTPSQFFLLSFRILIALVHLLHGNPYSLTLISIDGHLHSPLIRLVDVRLSSPFLSSPQPPFYSTYSAIPWLMLMYCVKIKKV